MKAFYPLAEIQLIVVVSCLCAMGADKLPGEAAESREDPAIAVKLEVAALPNAYRVSEKVISGGQPVGEEGFKTLQQLGVKTVISVDGAKPAVAIAKKFGLAYVHLPHGYDGISDQRANELAKAVTELPGPIYIHCHHGKHRSPVAAAVACIGAGLMTREDGQRLLELAGTSKDYRGLYEVVARSQRVPRLDSIKVEFRETVDVPPLATSMVQIERTFDNLKRIEQAGWTAPNSHPDLSPAHEALLLREHFTELLRTKEVIARPLAFRSMIERSRKEVESLEMAIRRPSNTPSPRSRERLSVLLSAIGNDCKRCHRGFRD